MKFDKLYPKIKLYSEVLLSIVFIYSLVALITIIGFFVSKETINILLNFTRVALIIFIVQEFVRILFVPHKIIHIIERWFEIAVSIFFIAILILQDYILKFLFTFLAHLTQIEILSIYLTALALILIITFTIKSTKYLDSLLKFNLHPSGLFALSFALIIIIGSILLTLPKATVTGESTSYLDALFTSTSAVCVTGLVVHNTADHFTLFGQTIILILIQIGGLGVMTLTTFFAAFLSGGLSVRVRFLMKDYLSQLNVSNIYSLILKIFIFTFVIELIGAFILFLTKYDSNSPNLGMDIFHSVFQSVSAFCNAGFSTYSMGLMDSGIIDNYGYITTISILIILGGLGFTVLLESIGILKIWKKNFRLYIKNNFSLSSKIVLISTILIITFGTIFIFALGINNGSSTSSIFHKLFHSAFLAITARTAGFNTIPIELISVPVVFIVLFIMWIGASPGSTGGGIKTTTFSLISLSLFNHIRGKERMELFHKEIDPNNIYTAFLVIIANIISLSIGIFILLVIEPSKQPFDLVFEAISAASTVGLTRNVTPYLGDGGKIVIILLMFIGRVGFLNFFLAFYKPSKEPEYHYKKETIMVG